MSNANLDTNVILFPITLSPRFTISGRPLRNSSHFFLFRFEERAGNFAVTELGRTASHYYLQHETIETFNTRLNSNLTDALIFDVVANAGEFHNVVVRDDEQEELRKLEDEGCLLKIRGLSPMFPSRKFQVISSQCLLGLCTLFIVFLLSILCDSLYL